MVKKTLEAQTENRSPRQTIRQGDVTNFRCQPGQQQSFLWDAINSRGEGLVGFGIRASKSGRKTYIFQGVAKKSNGEKCDFRFTIGRVDVLTLQCAREEARKIAEEVAQTGLTPKMRSQQSTELLLQEQQRINEEAASRELKRRTELKISFQTSLGRLCKQYWLYLARRKQPSNKDVWSCLNKHVMRGCPDLARKRASEVTEEEIADLLRAMTNQGLTRTVNKVRSHLHAAFSVAKKSRFSADIPLSFKKFGITRNPVSEIPPLECGRPKARKRVLTIAEVKVYFIELINMPKGPIKNVLIGEILSGGQRFAQLSRLTVQDFDPEKSSITIIDSKGRRRDPRLHEVPLGKTGAKFFYSLFNKSLLQRSSYLFPSVTDANKIIEKTNVSKHGNDICRKILDDGRVAFGFKCCDIRRTVETRLAQAGISKDTRAQLQSHGISGVQAIHYDHHDYINEKRIALEKWEELLLGGLDLENFV